MTTGLRYFEKDQNDIQPKSRPAVILYIHRVSNNLKRSAQKYDVHVVFFTQRTGNLVPENKRCSRRTQAKVIEETLYQTCVLPYWSCLFHPPVV